MPYPRYLATLRIGLLAVAMLIAYELMCPVRVDAQAPQQGDLAYERPVVIELTGQINRQLFKYFERKLAAAESYEADLVILDVESPGGLLEESLMIAERMRDVSWADTVAFIPEKALSGAALVSLGCDEILMKPTARIGDAGIIFLDEGFMFRYTPEKPITDLVRRARDLSEANGYPPELAEAMIDRKAVVYVRADPMAPGSKYRIEHLADPEEAPEQLVPKTLDDGAWVLLEESVPARFLEVNGTRAVELGLATANCDDLKSVYERFQLQSEPKVFSYNTIDSAVYWLNLPWITGLLFIVGLVALYIELSAPGISVGGLIAGLCFVLFFWSRFLGGTAVWLEVLLFVAGVIFLLLEIFVIPGTGLSGILGVLLIVVSLVMASQSFSIPRTTVEMGSLLRSSGLVLGSFLLGAIAIMLLGRYAGVIPVLSGFVLAPPRHVDVEPEHHSSTPPNKKEALAAVEVGDFGIAESVLRPAGKARVGTRSVDVIADGEYVEIGQAIRVVRLQGNHIIVRSADESAT